MQIDIVTERQKDEIKHDASGNVIMGAERERTDNNVVQALVPFLVAARPGLYPVLNSEVVDKNEEIKQQRVVGDGTTLDFGVLPDKGTNILSIMSDIKDTNKSGILGTVTADEIKLLCQKTNRRIVLVNKGEHLTVVSSREAISESFRPQNITTVTSKDIPVYNDFELNKEAKDALIRMIKYVNSRKHPNGNNYRLVPVSGYRSQAYPSQLHNRNIVTVTNVNPKPERSQFINPFTRVVDFVHNTEHALGTTVDFTTGEYIDRGGDILTNGMANTGEYALMAIMAWKFGWVNSLRPGKEHLTGTMTEAWHWRYVGEPHAEVMWGNDWIPEEYRDYMREHENIVFKSSTGELYLLSYDNETGTTSASELKFEEE